MAIAKRASSCGKKRTHRLIVISVGSGKEKQHLHRISAVHAPTKRACVWIVWKQEGVCRVSCIENVMLSQTASGNTQHTKVHKVNVKIVSTEQRNICGNANVAASRSISHFIVDGVKHME